MSIILPNLNHSFISPVPVPVPGSGSGFGFPGFPYAPCEKHGMHGTVYEEVSSGLMWQVIVISFSFNLCVPKGTLTVL